MPLCAPNAGYRLARSHGSKPSVASTGLVNSAQKGANAPSKPGVAGLTGLSPLRRPSSEVSSKSRFSIQLLALAIWGVALAGLAGFIGLLMHFMAF